MSVTRYDCEVWNHPVRGEDVRSVPSPDGRWVEYKDYEKLLLTLKVALPAVEAAHREAILSPNTPGEWWEWFEELQQVKAALKDAQPHVAEPIDWNIRDSSIEVPEDEK